jgi:hypothetical protein
LQISKKNVLKTQAMIFLTVLAGWMNRRQGWVEAFRGDRVAGVEDNAIPIALDGAGKSGRSAIARATMA